MSKNLYINPKEIKQIKVELNNLAKQIPGATASALNRTLDFTATQTSKIVREVYSIKDKDVKGSLKKKKANKSNLYAYLESSGRTLTLTRFPYNPKNSNSKKDIKVKVKKKEGYKVIKGSPKAFIQSTSKGTTLVWKRESSKRYPIKPLRTLSIPQMISNDENINKIQELANKKLEERIAHEINWRLEKASKRSNK